MSAAGRILYLSGGVGGARLLDGLARVVPPQSITALVNTGDDFRHLGLHIAPDLDTVMYTLAGLSHVERGWGLAEESFAALDMVRRYGGEAWFALGDRDLATHLLRSEALARGETLTTVTARLCRALGLQARVLPMADAPRPTMIDTAFEGTLSFQDWLVRRRGEPAVRAVRFEGTTAPAPGVIEAIGEASLVVIGPSNPYVSIDPILTLDGVREAIAARPVVAVSPIVGGAAIKGPLAAMLPALGGEAASAGAVARHYRGLLRGIVVEHGDEDTVRPGDCAVHGTGTVMRDLPARAQLARDVLSFAATLV